MKQESSDIYQPLDFNHNRRGIFKTIKKFTIK